MTKYDYEDLVDFVKRWLRKRGLRIDPHEIAHDIWINTRCEGLPPFCDKRIVDVMRQRLGYKFQRKHLHNAIELKPTHLSIKKSLIEVRQEMRILLKIINSLDPEERELVSRYLDGEFFQDIGKSKGLTGSRIGQRLKEIIKKMKMAIKH